MRPPAAAVSSPEAGVKFEVLWGTRGPEARLHVHDSPPLP